MSVCPIGAQTVDQRCAQGVAGQVLLLTLTWIATAHPAVLMALAADFLLRGAGQPRLSPLAVLARNSVRVLRLSPYPVNSGPKTFAAKIGLVFCLAILISSAAGALAVCMALSWILAVCAALECFLSVCVGCHLYTLLLSVKK